MPCEYVNQTYLETLKVTSLIPDESYLYCHGAACLATHSSMADCTCGHRYPATSNATPPSEAGTFSVSKASTLEFMRSTVSGVLVLTCWRVRYMREQTYRHITPVGDEEDSGMTAFAIANVKICGVEILRENMAWPVLTTDCVLSTSLRLSTSA